MFILSSVRSIEAHISMKELLGACMTMLVVRFVALAQKPLRVGGIEDHIHILLAMRGHDSVSKLVQEIKKSTTPWLKQQIPPFCWQEGYGAFSVSHHEVPGVIQYIDNQREHHERLTFEEERRILFDLAGIEYIEE